MEAWDRSNQCCVWLDWHGFTCPEHLIYNIPFWLLFVLKPSFVMYNQVRPEEICRIGISTGLIVLHCFYCFHICLIIFGLQIPRRKHLEWQNWKSILAVFLFHEAILWDIWATLSETGTLTNFSFPLQISEIVSQFQHSYTVSSIMDSFPTLLVLPRK